MKLRQDSTLSNLTEEQQAQLYDWIETLGYTEALKKVAAPPPDGFGLKTHRATLHGFFKRYAQQVRTEDLAAAKENRSNPEDSSVLVSDAEQSFQHAGHQIATGPMNTDDFAKVSRWLEWHKDAQLKRDYIRLAEQNAAIAQKKATLAAERLELEREKFRFNAGPQALIHFAELAKIARNHNADDEDKIRAAADLLFQAAPTPVAAALQPASSQPLTEAPPINTQVYLGESNELNDRTASAVSSATDNTPLTTDRIPLTSAIHPGAPTVDANPSTASAVSPSPTDPLQAPCSTLPADHPNS